MAWLNAKPKPPEGSHRAKQGKSKPISRIDQLRRDNIPVQMPPNPAPHIVQRLIEMGIQQAAGMGTAPICWREIEAWQVVTGVCLDPWEARLIHRLSIEYVAEFSRAESENCPAPYRTTMSDREKDVALERLKMLLD